MGGTIRRLLGVLAGVVLLASAAAQQVQAAAPGWAGETIIGAGDTWEPFVATDPAAPFVYAIYNNFSGPKGCNTCPSPYLVVRTSADNGVTFGPEVRLCSCAHIGFQFDPIVQVTSTGVVDAVYMNNYTIVFSKSSDHGATWSTPLKVSGKISSDKPWLGISPNGMDVYIAWTKGTGGDLYESTLMTGARRSRPPN